MTTSTRTPAAKRGKMPKARKSAAKKAAKSATGARKTLRKKSAARPTTAHRTSKRTSSTSSARSTSTARKKPVAKKPSKRASTPSAERWSSSVTEHSDALDLESGVFKKESATEVADSLKHSAEQSTRKKGGAFQSAMSMLNFYINRGGKNLAESRRELLERAKGKLREAFHRA